MRDGSMAKLARGGLHTSLLRDSLSPVLCWVILSQCDKEEQQGIYDSRHYAATGQSIFCRKMREHHPDTNRPLFVKVYYTNLEGSKIKIDPLS